MAIDDLQQPTGGLKGQVYSVAYELAAIQHWPTFIQVTRVYSRIWQCPIR